MDNTLGLIEQYRYFVLFPLAILEGPIIALIAGLLVKLKYLSLIPVFIIFIFGDIISDAFYYYIGRIGDQAKLISKYGSRYRIISENFGILDKLWLNHGHKMMFFVKLTYGLTIPFLVAAGLSKMSYKRFLAITFLPTAFKYFILISLGYYLARSFVPALHYIYYGGIIVATIVVLCIIGYRFAIKYLKSQIESLKD